MKNIISGIIEEKAHLLPVRVYYSDTDAGGVVYHSRYIDMAEHGRSEMLRLLGGRQFEIMKERGIVYVVRSLQIDYNSPAFLDDLLTVETRITRCAAFTILFNQKIMREDSCLAELKVKVGSVSLKEGKPSPIPDEWKSSLDALLATTATL
jgi:acyl-CoA thioester hydrolase